jgi:hypothetical protein
MIKGYFDDNIGKQTRLLSTAGLKELGIIHNTYVNTLSLLKDRSIYSLLREISGLNYVDRPLL